MQHHQQHDGVAQPFAGGYSQPGEEQQQRLGDLGIAEAASPISSRPPAAGPNFDELMRATAEAAGGSGVGSAGNRWPRQETMELLRIRSEMDAAFRDTTPKGPLWEQVSRKLAELGYHRNAKKCKEKFENVHKYYKRTKEGRTGRQDGKSYKFFTELEALHQTTATVAAPTSSVNPINTVPTTPTPAPAPVYTMPPLVSQAQVQVPHQETPAAPYTFPLRASLGVNFSSGSSSSSEGEDDEEDDEMETEPARHNDRKRKRGHDGGGIDSDQGMMQFFEGLMQQVMQKQEVMQQKFLEAIEKREQDRMIREEAWKRQDMARLAREHELMAQERTISASRDAAIIDFLQKITGETIQLPPSTVPFNPQPPTPISAPPPPSVRQKQQPQPILQQQQQTQGQSQQTVPSHAHKLQPPSVETTRPQPSNTSEIVPAVPEQQIVPYQDFSGGGGSEGTSSRWPKPEVLALIQIRSGMESRYQEAGPKGPLWEEISASMQRIGYTRNAKRCKEKWENINKYFKKVKESKKKRPEDAKTCPYYHELDALYQKKILGGTGGNISIGSGSSGSVVPGTWPAQQQQDAGTYPSQPSQINESLDKDAGVKMDLQTSNAGTFPSYLFGEQSQSAPGGAKQPEDSVRKQHQQSHGNTMNNLHSNMTDCNGDNIGQENDEYNYEEVDENEEYDDDTEEDMKLDYKIEFQRQKVGSSNGGGQAPASFLAMVQ